MAAVDLSVVIPVHNEAALLPAVLAEMAQGLREFGKSFEIVLVENGSTGEVARALCEQIPELRLEKLPEANYGRALRAGMRAARGERVVNFDIDYWDLAFLRDAYALAQHRFDIVIGSKNLLLSTDRRAFLRRCISQGFRIALRALFGLRVSDTHGIKLWRYSPELRALAERVRFDHHLFDTELILRAQRAGLRIVELPVEVRETRKPPWGILRRIPRAALDIVRLRVLLWREGCSALPGPPCPLCGAAATDFWLAKRGWRICRCGHCGLVFTAGSWPAKQAAAFYNEGYFSGHDPAGYTNYCAMETALRRTARDRLARLPPGERLLDVGCGPGVFLAAARERFRAIGCDISSSACRTARARGLPVAVADAAHLPFASETFDTVTMWDAIEHLADPVAALREVRRILRPGGSVALSTGDISSACARWSGRYWHLLNPPEHRYFFSLDTLDLVLTRAGLERRAASRAGARYTPAYLVERLVKSLGGSTRSVQWLLRLSWLHALAVPVNLFDIVTVTAVKPQR